MSSLSSIMDTSLSAMFSARTALNVVAHNIANSNTPGYSRQRTMFGTRHPNVMTYGSLGRGVTVTGIRRMTDTFLQDNFRVQNSHLATYTEVQSALQEVEAIFGSVENDHFGDTLNSFFAAWSELATLPTDDSLKTGVVTAAQAVATEFHSMNSTLTDLKESIETTLRTEVGSYNDLLLQVANLNQQIVAAESGGSTANDLHDQRDSVIDQISQLAKVSAHYRDDGSVTLLIAGRTMVSRDRAEQVEVRWAESDAGVELKIVTDGTRQEVTFTEGKLAGLLEARDNHVQSTLDALDGLASIIAEKVNEIHLQGRSGSSSGLAFFTGDNSSNLEVHSAILNNHSLVATSRTGSQGDNDLALEMANLSTTAISSSNTASLTSSYRSILVDLASQASRYEFLVENQDNVVASVDARLASARGVSLDEEGASLVQYQNAYQAAARVITTVQEMFATLIDLV
ncbi:MAG: flagellar hook-associated protein FlgK [bacterium]